jgi:hypothetical protein
MIWVPMLVDSGETGKQLYIVVLSHFRDANRFRFAGKSASPWMIAIADALIDPVAHRISQRERPLPRA